MATWYAQNSSVNIDSVNEWNSAFDGSGSWLTWASLGAGDILIANGKTSITINQDFTCAKISNKTDGVGADAGSYLVAAARTINAAVETGGATCITTSAGTYTLAVNGNVTGGTGASCHGIYNNPSSGVVTVTVTGVVTGGSGSGACGIYNNKASCPVNVYGGGNGVVAGSGGYAIHNASTGAITVGTAGLPTNVVTAGTIHAINEAGSGAITVYGNVTAGTSGNGIYGLNNVITVTGDVTGGSTTGDGIGVDSSATITVTGNVTGGSGTGAYGIYMNSTGTMTVNGNVTAGSASRAYGIYNLSTGVCTVTNGNIIHTTSCSAVMGKCYYNPGATNYTEYPKTGGGTTKLGPEPAAGSLIEGAQVGTVAGTYHEATEAEVEFGIGFGEDGTEYTGEYTGPSAEDVAEAVWDYAARTLT